MMKKTIKYLSTYTYHPILIVVFFILHISNENFGLVPINRAFEYLAYYLILACFFLIVSLGIFKNKSKAYLYTTFLLAIFLFFGALHDTIKRLPIPPILTSYKIFLPLIILIVIIVGFYIKKSNKNFKNINLYLNRLFLLLIIIDSFILANHIHNTKNKVDMGDPLKKLSKQYKPCDTCYKPDIYFIVFDGYSSSLCLKEEFSFDNSSLDSILYKNNFYISKKSRSNYNITPFSIASTFNLNYLSEDLKKLTFTPKLIEEGKLSLFRSELPVILKKEGYVIKNYSVFNIENTPLYTSEQFKGPVFGGIERKVIAEQTMAGRIQKDILWNWIKLSPSLGSQIRYKEGMKIEKMKAQEYVFNNIAGLLREGMTNTIEPKFVYTHVMIPHEPYIFNENGHFNKFPIWGTDQEKIYYLKQLQYCNKLITKIIYKLMSNRSRSKIIIIEGDHGFRNYNDVSKLDKIFCNLNAYYFPDYDYSNLYDSISPVNTFRVILNKFFKQNLPLLLDTSIYIRHPNTKLDKLIHR